MCFILPSKPKKKPKKGCWGTSSSSSSRSRGRSSPPSSQTQKYWDDKTEEIVQQRNDRAFNHVFSSVSKVKTLTEKLTPPPPPNTIATPTDVQKAIDAALAKEQKEIKEKERDALVEKWAKEAKDRDERFEKLAKDAKPREKRERREREDRERGQRGTSDLHPDVQALVKRMDQQDKDREDERKQREERERWEREKKQMKEDVIREVFGNGGGFPPINYVGPNNGGYNSLQAPPRQGLLQSSTDDDDWKRKWERRQADTEDAVDRLKRDSRPCQRGGYSSFH